jgi:hypothetical protein
VAIINELVDLIETQAEELSRTWLEDVRQRPETPTYHTYDEAELFRRSYNVISHLGRWISQETAKEEIAARYVRLGRERKQEGFALSEVIEALLVIRRVLWAKVLDDGLLDTALDLHKALELNHRVVTFFDRAQYYVARGYEE